MFDVRCSMFDVRCSMFDVRCSMFDVRCSMFDVRCSMFDVRCSMFDVRCSMFDVRCSHDHTTIGVSALGASSSSKTHVSLLPPPCELLTTRLPFLSATRVRPP